MIDTDTHCINCADQLREQLQRMRREGTPIAIGESGVRQRQRWSGRLYYDRHHPYGGFQTGVMALHAGRFRQLSARLCPGSRWWRCVHDAGLRSLPAADQNVWSALLDDKRVNVTVLPCGFHAETQVLEGVANLLLAEGDPALAPFGWSWNGDPCGAKRVDDVPLAITHTASPYPNVARLSAAVAQALVARRSLSGEPPSHDGRGPLGRGLHVLKYGVLAAVSRSPLMAPAVAEGLRWSLPPVVVGAGLLFTWSRLPRAMRRLSSER